LPDVHMASINTNTAPPTIHFTKFKTRSIRLQSTICSVATLQVHDSHFSALNIFLALKISVCLNYTHRSNTRDRSLTN
jgi:hypothetical protein